MEHNFETYIKRVLSNVDSESGISSGALSTADLLVHSVIARVAKNIDHLLLVSGKKTAGISEVTAAVSIALPLAMRANAATRGSHAVSKFDDSYVNQEAGVKISTTKRAGLLVSVSRVEHVLANASIADRQGSKTGVYLAAVVEYVLHDLLNESIKHKAANKVRITNRPLLAAVRTNAGLNSLFPSNKTVFSGGVFADKTAE